jgi:hypothetical protein
MTHFRPAYIAFALAFEIRTPFFKPSYTMILLAPILEVANRASNTALNNSDGTMQPLNYDWNQTDLCRINAASATIGVRRIPLNQSTIFLDAIDCK